MRFRLRSRLFVIRRRPKMTVAANAQMSVAQTSSARACAGREPVAQRTSTDITTIVLARTAAASHPRRRGVATVRPTPPRSRCFGTEPVPGAGQLPCAATPYILDTSKVRRSEGSPIGGKRRRGRPCRRNPSPRLVDDQWLPRLVGHRRWGERVGNGDPALCALRRDHRRV